MGREHQKLILAGLLTGYFNVSAEYRSEIQIMPGHDVFDDYTLPLPSSYLNEDDIPTDFSWGDVDGVSYLTKDLNQHIPQYCGSCWAHGTLSSLADRIKIAREAKGIEINLSVQHLLNCGRHTAGTCHGGSATGAYHHIKITDGIAFDTCQPYIACSSESKEGFCGSVDTTCSAINSCRTCATFGVPCSEIDYYPNASIAEYGHFHGVFNMQSEIYARGPIACALNAEPLKNYTGGVFDFDGPERFKIPNHVISVVGWGDDTDGTPYWIIRNSWGSYWGEMGYFRLKRNENQLGVESDCSWATPLAFTQVNKPCYEDGTNCVKTTFVEDPSHNLEAFYKKRGIVKH
jgi:cathepsin X